MVEMSSPDEDPVTKWLEQISDGHSLAEHKLWEKYARHVERIARQSLQHSKMRMANEEDVVAAVLNSLFVGLKSGKVKPIKNRRHLQALLRAMAKHKSSDIARHQSAKKRGLGKVKGDSGFRGFDDRLGSRGINAVPDKSIDPVEALERAETLANMLRRLPDDSLREVATLKIGSYTNAEIADRLGLSERTIERKLVAIRAVFDESNEE